MINNEIVKVLMSRDGLSEDEALSIVRECRKLVRSGEDPEDVLLNELGLEPDYIFDLI